MLRCFTLIKTTDDIELIHLFALAYVADQKN